MLFKELLPYPKVFLIATAQAMKNENEQMTRVGLSPTAEKSSDWGLVSWYSRWLSDWTVKTFIISFPSGYGRQWNVYLP